MNSKMTTNSQLLTTEPIKKIQQKQTKQTTRIGTESEKWTSHGGFHWGEGGEEYGEQVQGIRSIIGRHKIDKERPKML